MNEMVQNPPKPGDVRATRQRAAREAATTPGADRVRGRALFDSLCAACHTLHGMGGKIAPDLTGSGRADLDYLLENIVDPGAIVAPEYRNVSLVLKDGRTLGGMIAADSDRTLTLRQPGHEETVSIADVTRRTSQQSSLMPDALLDDLSDADIRALIAYLQHPTQVFQPPMER